MNIQNCLVCNAFVSLQHEGRFLWLKDKHLWICSNHCQDIYDMNPLPYQEKADEDITECVYIP